MKDLKDIFRGCLVGGAAGDALGYAVEFCSMGSIIFTYGEKGIQHYTLTKGVAETSDDTQMTLYTAAGLIASARSKRGCIPHIADAYKVWCDGQFGRKAEGIWLADVPEINQNRAPGTTCLSAIESGCDATVDSPVNNSKGCGGVMRVAPVGLYFNDPPQAADIAADAAALTHGHELGYISAAALAYMISVMVYGDLSVVGAARCCIKYLGERYSSKENTPVMVSLMEKALTLAASDNADSENIPLLGEGWIGEEALAIALYCAARYENDFSACIRAAVNHKGDSDSTGSIAGNILGAAWGCDRIPDIWKSDLERLDVILTVADDLHSALCGEDIPREYGQK